MDASLVDPLEKEKNIELFDRDIILNIGKPITSVPIKKNIQPKVPAPKKSPPDYSRDIEAPKILHPMDELAAMEFLFDKLKVTSTNQEFFDAMKR